MMMVGMLYLLSEEERTAAETAEDIDSKYPRPTPDDVKKLLEKITSGADEDAEPSSAEKEAINELGN